MVWVTQMAQLMDDHIVKHTTGSQNEPPTEAHASIACTASPAARLVAHQHSGWLHTHQPCEVEHALGEDALSLNPIPLLDDTLDGFVISEPRRNLNVKPPI